MARKQNTSGAKDPPAYVEGSEKSLVSECTLKSSWRVELKDYLLWYRNFLKFIQTCNPQEVLGKSALQEKLYEFHQGANITKQNEKEGLRGAEG